MRNLLPLKRLRALPIAAIFVGLGLSGCGSTSYAGPSFARPPIACVHATTVDFANGAAFWNGHWAVVNARTYLDQASSPFRFLAAPDDDSHTPHRQLLFEIQVVGSDTETRRVRVTITNMHSKDDLRAVMALAMRDSTAAMDRTTSLPLGRVDAPIRGRARVTPIATDEEIARLERTQADFLWAPTPSGRTTLPLETPGDARALRLTLVAVESHLCQRPAGMLAGFSYALQ